MKNQKDPSKTSEQFLLKIGDLVYPVRIDISQFREVKPVYTSRSFEPLWFSRNVSIISGIVLEVTWGNSHRHGLVEMVKVMAVAENGSMVTAWVLKQDLRI